MDSFEKEAVKLEDVWFSYKNYTALREINLTIKERDFLGIIGPNGGGKTTLLKIILGLIKPNRGKISVFGHLPKKSRKFIGYVPQRSLFEQDFPISISDVVMMGRYGKKGLLKQYDSSDKEATVEALKIVGMYRYKNKQIGELSGGEQQRVFIARALANKPKLLLLDEPNVNIDSRMQKDFYELLEKLSNEMAIVLVSHDISAISTSVKKVACLNQKLFYHESKEIKKEDLEKAYQCPIEMIAHGMPHRVLEEH
ncbi:MAG: metal ABC transporter ATP-binding protein [Candidatus Methanofastidiosia archaeon]